MHVSGVSSGRERDERVMVVECAFSQNILFYVIPLKQLSTFPQTEEGVGLKGVWVGEDYTNADYLTSYPKVITAGSGPQEATERHLRGRGGSGGERERVKSVECLVQLSVGAEVQEVTGALAAINNALPGVQRRRK